MFFVTSRPIFNFIENIIKPAWSSVTHKKVSFKYGQIRSMETKKAFTDSSGCLYIHLLQVATHM